MLHKNVTVSLAYSLTRDNAGTSLAFNIVQYMNIMPLKGITAFLSLDLNSKKHKADA